MVFGHDHVGLAVRLVAVGELTGHAVHGLDRVAELDAFDAAGGDERGGLLRDHADHTDPHAIDVLDAVFLKRRRTGALLVHVRAEIIPLRVALAVGADHAAGQVVVPLVELVVADRGGLEPQRVEHVDGRLVLLRRRIEQRGADAVAGRQQQRRIRVLGAQLLDGSGERHRQVLADAAMEIVEVQQIQRGRAAGRAGGRDSDDHRIMVGGAELIGLVQVLRIVVVARVFQRHGFDGVDVPDVRAGHGPHRGLVGEDVVERADPSVRVAGFVLDGVGVGVLAGLFAHLLAQVGVSGRHDLLDRFFGVVGVEVADEEDLLQLEIALHLIGEREQRVGLRLTGVVGVAGAVAGILVERVARRALGLEVVGDDEERIGVGSALGLERLGVGLAAVLVAVLAVERVGVGEDSGFADGRDLGGLVDERGADHVLHVEVGDGLRAGHVGPGAFAGLLVERVDQRGERVVAALALE